MRNVETDGVREEEFARVYEKKSLPAVPVRLSVIQRLRNMNEVILRTRYVLIGYIKIVRMDKNRREKFCNEIRTNQSMLSATSFFLSKFQIECRYDLEV